MAAGVTALLPLLGIVIEAPILARLKALLKDYMTFLILKLDLFKPVPILVIPRLRRD